MQDDMVQVGHSRGIFDLSNCFCLDLNLEYVLMDFISRGSKFQATIDQGLIDISAEFPNTQIILCPLTGVDIRKYNKLSEIPADQVRMNYTVTTINAMIKCNDRVIECNNCRNLPTLCVSTKVHQCKGRGKWSHRYKYMSKDGCHFSEELRHYHQRA